MSLVVSGLPVILSQNENPFGPSPKALQAVSDMLGEMNRYPEPHSGSLKDALAAQYNVSPGHILVTAGLVEAIDILVRNFVSSPQNLVVSEYSFVAYRMFATIFGKDIRYAPAGEGGKISNENLLACCDKNTRLLFVDNPNNPTGTYLSHDSIRNMLDVIPKSTWLVLDEAYAEYVDAPDYPRSMELLATYPNLIVMRSFSKIFGLAAMRVGYVIAEPELIAGMEHFQSPFTVNKMAANAAMAALGDRAYVQECYGRNLLERKKLQRALIDLGFEVLPSQANFLFMRFRTQEQRDRVYGYLYDQGVQSTRTDSFGCECGLRISFGTAEQNSLLLKLFGQIVQLT